MIAHHYVVRGHFFLHVVTVIPYTVIFPPLFSVDYQDEDQFIRMVLLVKLLRIHRSVANFLNEKSVLDLI